MTDTENRAAADAPIISEIVSEVKTETAPSSAESSLTESSTPTSPIVAASTRKRLPSSEAADGEPKNKKQKSDDDDEKQIRKQIEYYFSDENLKRDKFFHSKISEDAEVGVWRRFIILCFAVLRRLMY